MLESSGVNTGSFRVRSTGFVGDTKASIVATFKRASLLDYIYFTQLETSDPVTYGYSNPSAALSGAYSQCSKFLREGRQSSAIPGTGGNDFCTQIVFVTGDTVDGPLHTNDALQICGTPTFGRIAGRRDRGQLAAARAGSRAAAAATPQLRRPVRDDRAGADPAADQRQAEDDRRAPTTYSGAARPRSP